MFGKKQDDSKLLVEKLRNAQTQIDLFQTKMAQMKDSVGQAALCFESQIVAQSGMDKGLTNVVSHAYDTIAVGSEDGQALEQLAIELTNLRRQLKEEEQEKKRLQEIVRKQKESAEALKKDENKEYIETTRILQKAQEELAGSIADLRGQFRQMQDLSKQMGVLSLNCAIEAGRMGGKGREFIRAAEDVRQLSGAYGRAAEAASAQVDEIEERIHLCKEQSDTLAKTVQASHASAMRLSKSLAEDADLSGRVAERFFSEKVAALNDILKKISQNHGTIDSLQNQLLHEMEQVGEHFVEEQEARKKLEQIFDGIAKKM